MFHVIIGLLTAIALFWGWFEWKNRKLLSLARKLPTVKPTLPLIGHLHHIRSLDSIMAPFSLELTRQAASEGKSELCLWKGPVPMIFTLNPDDFQLILNSSTFLERGPEMKLIQCILGDGMLAGKVSTWRPIRRHLQPMFRPRSQEQLITIFNNEAKHMIAELSSYVGCGPMNVLPILQGTNLTNILRFILGPDGFNKNPDQIRHAYQTMTRGLQLWAIRLVRFWLHLDFIFKILYWKEYREIEKLSSEFTAPAIQEFRCKTAVGQDTLSDEPTVPEIFAHALPLDPNMNEERLKREILTLCSGGTDTTSLSMAACLLALAIHPEIQEKTYAEIRSAMGDREGDVTLNDLQRMPYLQQVVKETLRRFTIIPYSSRETTGDVTLSFGSIPSGTTIYLSAYGVHMNPHIYPEPEKFDPDRFTPENQAKRHKFSHLPFSGGPRSCLGKDYAMISIKTTMVYILRAFRISTPDRMEDIRFNFAMELMKENGYPIIFQRRV